jgi:hypothetical protein
MSMDTDVGRPGISDGTALGVGAAVPLLAASGLDVRRPLELVSYEIEPSRSAGGSTRSTKSPT